jgi:hypothetical protein
MSLTKQKYNNLAPNSSSVESFMGYETKVIRNKWKCTNFQTDKRVYKNGQEDVKILLRIKILTGKNHVQLNTRHEGYQNENPLYPLSIFCQSFSMKPTSFVVVKGFKK